MPNTIVTLLTIQNKKGLHARAASLFVKEVEKFSSEAWVEKDGNRVVATSIMGLMMLAASKGTQIKVGAKGQDAQQLIDAISTLVNDRFHENE